MGDSQDQNLGRQNAINEIVWKARHAHLPDAVLQLSTNARILRKPVERQFDRGDEALAKSTNTTIVESGSSCEIEFSFGEKPNLDHGLRRRSRTRASASAAGVASVSPAR